MIEKLTDEERTELGFMIRAVIDLFEELSMPAPHLELLAELVRSLVATALVRAKPNRRMAYTDQWRQFLCYLPDLLSGHPADQRLRIAASAISQFRLQDGRGRRKPGPSLPAGTNQLLRRGEALWCAKVPEELLEKSRDQADLVQNPKTQFLRPLNQALVFAQEYHCLYPRFKGHDNLNRENLWKSEFPDVPVTVVRRWFDGWKPNPSDLAMLIAARRAGFVPSRNNLSTFREILATEKLLK
jgi:hypothetical protein